MFDCVAAEHTEKGQGWLQTPPGSKRPARRSIRSQKRRAPFRRIGLFVQKRDSARACRCAMLRVPTSLAKPHAPRAGENRLTWAPQSRRRCRGRMQFPRGGWGRVPPLLAQTLVMASEVGPAVITSSTSPRGEPGASHALCGRIPGWCGAQDISLGPAPHRWVAARRCQADGGDLAAQFGRPAHSTEPSPMRPSEKCDQSRGVGWR